MKTIHSSARFSLIAAMLIASADLAYSENTVLQVDFNAGTSNEMAGWRQFGWPTGDAAGPATYPYTGLDPAWTSSGVPGSVTLVVAAGTDLNSSNTMLTRDRKAPVEDTTGFPYSNVYRDFLNASTSVSLWLGLSGLSPNTAYDVTLYVYDNNNSRTMIFIDYTHGNPGCSGDVSYTAAYSFSSSTPTNVFATTLSVVSDANGSLLIRDLPEALNAPGTISGLSVVAIPQRPSFALKVDFGVNLAKIQNGFSPFGVSSGNNAGPISNSYGGLNTNGCSGVVTVTLTGGTNITDASSVVTARDRNQPDGNNGTFTYSGVYRDFVNNVSDNEPMWLELSGLLSGARYDLTLYAYDNNNTRTMTFTDYTKGTPGVSGSVAYSAGTVFGASTPNDVLSTTLSVRANESGRILVQNVPSAGGALINGLYLVYIPPQGTLLAIR